MGNNKYKILIVEDEANIRSFIKANLETSDYQVLCAETCALGIMMYASHRPDLIVLDLGLPDRDGLDLIQKVRESDTVPIIVLSARSNERDKVEALDLGANDYITKPFGTEELLARIRAVLRSHRHSKEEERSPGGKFRLQDLLIDYDTRQVFVGKEEIDLTQTEYNIMAFLSVHAGKVLTYAAIIRAVWGYSDYGSVKKLQVNMKNIRKKMGVTPGEKRYIINPAILHREFTRSGYSCAWTDRATNEWLLTVNNGIVTKCSHTGGDHGWQLFSVSRWTAEDGQRLRKHLELEFVQNENRSIYWDDVAMFCHPDEYQFGVYPISAEDLREIDSFTELCEADSSYRGRVN